MNILENWKYKLKDKLKKNDLNIIECIIITTETINNKK